MGIATGHEGCAAHNAGAQPLVLEAHFGLLKWAEASEAKYCFMEGK